MAPDTSRIHQLGVQSTPAVILPEPKNLLIAGHDYKFLGELVSVLDEIPGLTVTYDEWPTQSTHDVSRSDELLSAADGILCEFSSHNAVWYSWHKRPGQRLIVHFHGYELFQDFVHDINVDNVDLFVFVSEFYRRRVVQELGWPNERTVVVPNMIDIGDYRGVKIPDARFHLGLAGYVPILKRPDRALDLLEMLLEHDDRYVLHLRGRNPWDYSWMWQQPVTQDAYRAFYERLTDDPELLAHVSFDPFGPDMGQWFRRIGWMLSPSSRETFHLAPVEGQASGAIPVVWDREGAAEIFPGEFVHADTQAAARAIINANQQANRYDRAAANARRSVERFDVAAVTSQWADALFGEGRRAPQISECFERSDLLDRLQRDGRTEDLDRLILLVLLREQDLTAAEELIERFPEHRSDLSALTRDTLREMRMDQSFRTGGFARPPRSLGVAYQPRYGTALFVREGTDWDTVPVDAVQIIADTVTRQARVERPAALAVAPDAVAAWGTLVAARRLGIPAILVGERGQDEWFPPADEFDAAVTREGEVTSDVVQAAVTMHARLAKHTDSVSLSELTVGMIADEFTERTISGRCRVIRIPRHDAYLSVVAHDLDVLFVESAWSGHGKQWFHGVAYYKDDREDIERVIATARAKGVPVIFWNKEDPVHFRSFAPTAALCDAVYTTDADRIPAYLELGGEHRPAAVASMPFFAEPTLHHPLPGTWAEKPTVSYAGTYYGARYAERSEELDVILGAAAQLGLTIYDRQINIPNSPYRFPARYDEFIEGGLSYEEVLEAYKAHPVHINVNSVKDSPTMFSRRVVEIAASGSVVVSGKGRGVRESLPAVTASDNSETLGIVMAGCLGDRSHWRASAWAQLRAVRRSYLAEYALAVMFRGAGVPVRLADETAWSAVVDRLTPEIATNLAEQTHPPTGVSALLADDAALATLIARGIPVTDSPVTQWTARWEEVATPTWAEDLMYAARFAPDDVSRIGARTGTRHERGLITWDGATRGPVFSREMQDTGRTLIWLLPDQDQKPFEDERPEETHE
ncbi:glycosyltransferase [Kocuria sp. cx-455]|uniref:glycosyltransferase n=1 Tax=Kocuria sp. cx-455 TaxID=2771377 RepID=UPI0016858E69|nr:glycosyltransferase [Kocuria sp. cx-455]MBD2765032.1 glycosyltransferase [Kocuria sp. cx-455]